MYHVELRQFPHNFCRFNLTERELHETILDMWLRGEWVELGERKWNPHQAQLTVLESPELPVEQLSMGRGWHNAKRQGQDVTERLLAGSTATASIPTRTFWSRLVGPATPGLAERRPAAGYGDVPGAGTRDIPGVGDLVGTGTESASRLAADSLGLEFLAQLETEPVPLAQAWRLARERYPERLASDCLSLAELAVRSLADAGLVVVLVAGDNGAYKRCVPGEQVEQALRAIEGWSRTDDSATVRLLRV